jgi:transposase
MSVHENESSETVICPHCGEDHGTELADGILTCDECGKSFRLRTDTTVTYTTRCVEHVLGSWEPIIRCPGWESSVCSVCGEIECMEIKKANT